MVAIQLDFFKSENESKIDALEKSINNIGNSSEKVRKGAYASINEIRKKQEELDLRISIIEKHLCCVHVPETCNKKTKKSTYQMEMNI